jgi:AIR synthase-related protein
VTANELESLTHALLAGRGFAHKVDIGDVLGCLGKATSVQPNGLTEAIAVGDDCAAIPDGDGYLLFAIEGFVEDFVKRMPWFAGYCGVMVNVSDIAAMGGRPIAVVDALWSRGMHPADEVLKGMAEASSRYGVPVVGGHTNNRSERGQLAVAILGRAKKLLTSFDARPGDVLVMAIDLRGQYEDDKPYWNASTSAPAERLRDDLALLPLLAESDLCDAAKDISMAGAVGTALMLAECSRVGLVIDVDAIPKPAGIPMQRWLQSFPSFGFVMSVRPEKLSEVIAHFSARDIACAAVGTVNDSTEVCLTSQGHSCSLWDWNDATFITARTPSITEAA